jgi:hypothetical protein
MGVLTYAYVWFDLERGLGADAEAALTTATVLSMLCAPYAGSFLFAGRGVLLRLMGAGLGVLAASAALWLSLEAVLRGGTAACGADDCGMGFGTVAYVLMWVGLALAVPTALLRVASSSTR